ncbi:MAG: VWA domain-containing protein, partial [Spirochaetes bacterium]|nr:VWA domain-containing protein [Spirochaetota bacterium]
DNLTGWETYQGGTKSLGTTPADGTYTLRAWLRDAAGNLSNMLSFTVTYDSTAPAISSFNIVPPVIGDSSSIAVTIAASDATSGIEAWAVTTTDTAPAAGSTEWKTAGITASGAPGEVNISGTISVSFTVSGTNTLYAWVKDRAGNVCVSSESDTVIYQPQGPTFSVKLTSYRKTDNLNISFNVISGDDPSLIARVKFSDTNDIGTGNDWIDWGGGLSHEYVYTISAAYGDRKVYVWVRNSANTVSGPEEIDITIRNPRKIYLVLDYSGSMLDETAWAGGSMAKIDILEASANALVSLASLWEAAGEKDRIGIIKFHNNIYPMTFPGGEEMGRLLAAPPDIPNSSVETDVGAFLDSDCLPDYCTGMGAGLAEALNRLNYDVSDVTEGRRAVFLISDGIQNRTPFLKISGSENSYSVLIDNSNPDGLPVCGNTGYSAIPVQFNETGAGGSNCYPLIYTAGIGTFAGWQITLQQTAEAGGGSWIANPDTLEAVETFFNDAISDIYAGNSPQLVFSTRDNYRQASGREEYSYTVLLNKSISSFAVKLVWAGYSELTFEIWKGDVRVASYDKKSNGFLYEIAVIDFPHSVNSFYSNVLSAGIKKHHGSSFAVEDVNAKKLSGFTTSAIFGHETIMKPLQLSVDPEGEWTIRVHPTGERTAAEEVPFYLSVFAEEHSLSIEIPDFPSSIIAGQALNINVDIYEGKRALLSQYSMQSKITKPKYHFGSVLSSFSVEKFDELYKKEAGKREITQASFKAELLMKDKRLREKVLETETEKIVLVSEWRSSKTKHMPALKPRFSGITKNTKTPGLYQIELTVRGTGKECGSYQRMIKRTVLVKFKADTEHTMTSSSLEIKGKTAYLAMVPTDKDMNLLGPGWALSIVFRIGGIRFMPEDHGDGSYLFKLPLEKLKAGGKVKVQLEVIGISIFKGNTEMFIKALNVRKRKA